ncbi:MAG TPA: lytic transglycosylase domain-containing protein, partial [Alphaproteobacteria bacterium]|nr:lytic transglycosylase domain-containing protein [Alphaproteobacteria bacterium]
MRRPLSPTFPGRPAAAALRLSLTAAALQLLAACASAPPPAVTAPVVVAAPSPGWGAATPSDPWGPYIAEASARFDVPEAWIRTVMQIESGGRTTLNGRPITSSAGAQGLMQVMPATFEALRRKHGLGPDPYDPFTNIMAGTAYIREMYDIYGAPGFLAAYNCGPGCYGDYLAGARTLPAETRRYLAMGTPGVQGHLPRVQTAGGDIGLPTTVIAAAPRPAAPPPLPAPARPAPARPVAVAMTA